MEMWVPAWPRDPHSPGLELEVSVSCQMSVLGTKLRSCARAVQAPGN